MFKLFAGLGLQLKIKQMAWKNISTDEDISLHKAGIVRERYLKF